MFSVVLFFFQESIVDWFLFTYTYVRHFYLFLLEMRIKTLWLPPLGLWTALDLMLNLSCIYACIFIYIYIPATRRSFLNTLVHKPPISSRMPPSDNKMALSCLFVFWLPTREVVLGTAISGPLYPRFRLRFTSVQYMLDPFFVLLWPFPQFRA